MVKEIVCVTTTSLKVKLIVFKNTYFIVFTTLSVLVSDDCFVTDGLYYFLCDYFPHAVVRDEGESKPVAISIAPNIPPGRES